MVNPEGARLEGSKHVGKLGERLTAGGKGQAKSG